jgi:predicted MFS family arabinose efflux permease
MTADGRRILAAQAVRAVGYGMTSVLLGASLKARGWSSGQVGALLAAVLAGTAIASIVVGRYANRIGRRRLYAALFVGLAGAGVVYGLTTAFWALFVAALAGTLSTDVVESGPFTSLEQAMLPATTSAARRTRAFGVYNAVAAVAGSLGALAAGLPALLGGHLGRSAAPRQWFLVLVPIGLIGAGIASRLTATVESSAAPPGPGAKPPRPLERSRSTVAHLAALFAVDSFAGGFAVQAFIAYWLSVKFGASLQLLAVVFFGVGILQSLSFLVASRLADRFGLLNTMVFTHLPSNVLLAAIPLAPTLPLAIVVLFARFALSQMDVPTRQAYVAALVDPDERPAAAAYTNTARYVVRPAGAALAGVAQRVALGLPFMISGGIKVAYDLALFAWFRRVPLPRDAPEETLSGERASSGGEPRRRRSDGRDGRTALDPGSSPPGHR